MAPQSHFQALVVAPAKAYAHEARGLLPCLCPHPASDFDLASLSAAARAAAVVLFVKPGCGHCARAKAATAGLRSREVVALPSAGDRAALAATLGLPAITVPVAFVQGRCVGDGERLRDLLADEPRFAALLRQPMAPDPFAPGVPDTRCWTERHLCRAPGGSTPCVNYFLNAYGNTVRAISAVHCACFALVLAGALSAGGARALAWLVAVDLVLFVGSQCLSPLALGCTAAVWTRRGPVVPAIPYKVVFALYVVALVRIASGVASDTEVGGSCRAVCV
jgi:glutaredoxin